MASSARTAPNTRRRPSEIAPGATLALRLVVPESALSAPCPDVEDPQRPMVVVPGPPQGQAVEVSLLLTDAIVKVSGWPGRRSTST